MELLDQVEYLSDFPFYPTNDFVLILPVELERKTEHGLFLPEGHEDSPHRRGIVIKTGPGEWRKKAKQVEVEVDPLDVVLYPQYAVYDLDLGGQPCSVVSEREILMVVDRIEL